MREGWFWGGANYRTRTIYEHPATVAFHRHLDRCKQCRRTMACLARLVAQEEVKQDHEPDGPPPTQRVAVVPHGQPLRQEAETTRVLARGDTIGRFVVIGTVGQGGMGQVYDAVDPELHRHVAIKVVRTDHLQEADQTTENMRLLREAQALARLNHPNVVTIHEVGRFGRGIYLAQEYVKGQSLHDWLRSHPRSWKECLHLFMQAGQGLAAAHQAGIIHRDFKPANVLVGEDGRVRVVDFGVARKTRGGLPETSHADEDAHEPTRVEQELTHAGMVLGTPGYMAPEQLTGQQADERSDQFAFCVSLFEALYGARPFTGDTPEQLTSAMRSGSLDVPRTGHRIPRWLKHILLRGLKHDPRERYPSMHALLKDLAADPAARLKHVAVGAAVVGLLAAPWLAWGGMVQWRQSQCTHEATQLQEFWNEQQRERVRSAFVATGLPFATDAFSRVQSALDAYVQTWSSTYVDACLEATPARAYGDAPITTPMTCLKVRLAQARAAVRLFAQADSMVVLRALDAIKAIPAPQQCVLHLRRHRGESTANAGTNDPLLERLRSRLAEMTVLRDAGRYQEALTKAAALLEEAQHTQHLPLLAEIHAFMATTQGRAGNLDAAESSIREARWAAEVSGHDVVAAEAAAFALYPYTTRANRDEFSWMVKQADGAIRRAGMEHLRIIVENAIGGFETHQHNPTAALQHYQEALNLFMRLGDGQPSTFMMLTNNLAFTLLNLGELDQARERYNAAVEWGRLTLGPEHPDTAFCVANLACLESQLTVGQAVRDRLEHAVATMDRGYATISPKSLYARLALAHLHMQVGGMQEANTLLLQTEQVIQRETSQHPLLPLQQNHQAILLGHHGLHQDALRVLDQTLPHSTGADATRLRTTRAWLRWLQGQCEDAARVLAEPDPTIENTSAPLLVERATREAVHGLVMLCRGQYVEALAQSRHAQATVARALGRDAPSVLALRSVEAQALLHSAEWQQGMRVMQPLVDHLVRHGGDRFLTASNQLELAWALWKQQSDRARAMPLAQAAVELFSQHPGWLRHQQYARQLLMAVSKPLAR